MGYIGKTLASDELILSKFEIHPIIYVECILFILLIFPIYYLIKLSYVEYALTNKRVVKKAGIIRNTKEIRLPEVETVEVKQGIIWRFFGYGNVIITSTGSSKVVFSYVPKPFQAKEDIGSQLIRLKKSNSNNRL